MSIDILTEFFMWFAIINFAMIIIFYLTIRFLFVNDFIYNAFIKSMYLGTKEEFNKLIVSNFFLYRILFAFFALFPYLALLIIK